MSSELNFGKRYTLRDEYKKTPRIHHFRLASLFGNCCWKVWSRYRGGRPLPMATPDVYQTMWAIKSVELVKTVILNNYLCSDKT